MTPGEPGRTYIEVPGDDDARGAALALIEAARARILHLFDLAAAEARLAAMSSLTMLLLAIVAGAALIVAWTLLVAVAIYALASANVPWPAAAIGFAAAHVAVAYWLWRATVRLSRNLTLPELRTAIPPGPI
jgi:hypothetical protein